MHRVLPITAAIALFVTTLEVRAEVQSKRVEYEHGGQTLEGTLAWDDATSGERPGVLVVHEWWGLDDYARGRAEQLAELGYVAFALDMYGKGKLTEHPNEAAKWSGQIRENIDNWVERSQTGLKILQEHSLVDSARIAAIGYCFGGATVMQMAYSGAPLAGVVSFHGSLPVATEEQGEQIKARVLVCHGAADAFVPEARAAEFRKALNAAGADWQMVYYAGAKHSFTNPDADSKGIAAIGYQKEADVRSWALMQAFFDEMFAD